MPATMVMNAMLLLKYKRKGIVSAPTSIILPAKDLLDTFRKEIHNNLNEADIFEIVTQIVFVLLNDETGTLSELERLPAFDRLYSPSLYDMSAYHHTVCVATVRLGKAIHQRLKELGAYHGNLLPYFFDRFVSNDLILGHLPY